MPPFEPCEQIPKGVLPPLEMNKITDLLDGNLKDQIDLFLREMPGPLIDDLNWGIVEVNHMEKTFIMRNSNNQPFDHHFF